MTYSIIKKSQLEGALRLDAKFYQPEYLSLINNLDKLKAIPIKQVAINSKRKFNPKKDEYFDYIEISEINLSTGEYNKSNIIGSEAPDRAQWTINKDDIIISTVRPIRNAISLITEKNSYLVCSSGFAVLKSKKTEPEYLFAYLKSKPIIKLLDRQTTATMYPAITIEDILNIKIYLGDNEFRKKIVKLIKFSMKELLNSKKFYQQAENLLLDRLKLKNFETDKSKVNIVNLSDVKSANRIDAEYFQKKYEKLIGKIKKQKYEKLENIIENVEAKFNPKTKSEEKFKYVELSNINQSIGTIEDFTKVLGKNAPSRAKRLLKENDVIVSSVEGSLKKVALVNKNQENYLASTGFFQFRSKKILPEVLLILAKSIVLQFQLKQRCAGTILTAVPQESIKNILIPILPKSTQQTIAELVRKSHTSRQKSKQLLEQAKKKVEEIIEKEDK